MSFKSKLGIFGLTVAIAVFALIAFVQKGSYSTETVMESLWDEHNVQSTMIGDDDPILDVSVYDEENITDVESYLESNLSEEDLEHYKLNVYQYSENPLEFSKNAQENLD